MAYQKQKFIDDETVLTAEIMGHIEDGIVQNETDIKNKADLDESGRLNIEQLPEIALTNESLTSAVNTALAQAKASGDFKGEKGDKGDTGEQGIQGEKGDQGIQGIQGEKGDKGDTGEKGNSGVYIGSGAMPDGYNVQIDPNGEVFDFESFKGEKGEKGEKGKDGKTAYEYASEGGYSGNELEFAAKLATPFVTPQMFGAKGDGVTDDTQAFKNAFATNNEVFLPKGNYLITETINLSNGKRLYSTNREGTVLYKGTGSVFYLGRRTIVCGIKVRIESSGVTNVFDTDNKVFPSSHATLMTMVNDVEVYFAVKNPEATLINIVATNKDDIASNGFHNQHYSNIHVAGEGSIRYGIKICVRFDAPYVAGVTGKVPWITDIRFNHIWLGSPYCAIKIHRENNSGTEIDYNSIVRMEHMMFTDIASQYMTLAETRKFYEVEWCMAEFINCQPWDYHHVLENGLKYNTIGQGALLSELNARRSPIDCAEFPSVTATTPDEDPVYFLKTFFNFQSNIDGAYDYIDMKCQQAVESVGVDEVMVESIAQRVVDKSMSGVYFNVMADEITQVKVFKRFSNSSQSWVDTTLEGVNDVLIIPIKPGTNLIRWKGNELSDSYKTVFFHNNLTSGVAIDESTKLTVISGDDTYLKIENPKGYPLLSIPFEHTEVTMNADNMIVTINQLIKESSLSYVSEHLNNVNIHVTSEDKEKWDDKYTKDESDNKYLTEHQDLSAYAKTADHYTKTESDENYQPKGNYLTSHQDISGKADKSSAEAWTFTLADGSTVTKKVVLTE